MRPGAPRVCGGILALSGLLSGLLSGHASETAGPPEVAAGVWLPVTLRHGVKAGKSRVGTTVAADLTQRVPPGGGRYLDRHDRVLGSVVASSWRPMTGQDAGVLTIRFDTLLDHGRSIPIRTEALAVASFVDAADTVPPITGGPDRGNASPASWTTVQVGGDEVYRSGWVGDVCDRVMKKVGTADFEGVYTLPVPLGGERVARAVGVFSTTARGLYGFGNDASLTSGDGAMTLHSPGRPGLHGGDHLLLEVEAR